MWGTGYGKATDLAVDGGCFIHPKLAAGTPKK